MKKKNLMGFNGELNYYYYYVYNYVAWDVCQWVDRKWPYSQSTFSFTVNY